MSGSLMPCVGFTLDYETGGGYSKMPWYAIRENYLQSVEVHGALALPLGHALSGLPALAELLDGIVVTGGAFDVPPSMYGEAGQHATVHTKDARTAFEFALIRLALEKKMPILGICGGQQLLNVVLGGTLIQHIPDAVTTDIEHEQPNPRTEPGHTVAITPETLLHRVVGKAEMAVNSAHHQAVAKPAPGTVVNALAPDGVIEGIEYPEHPFCLGVQWHPEYAVDADDTTIFKAFVEACRAYRGMR